MSTPQPRPAENTRNEAGWTFRCDECGVELDVRPELFKEAIAVARDAYDWEFISSCHINLDLCCQCKERIRK